MIDKHETATLRRREKRARKWTEQMRWRELERERGRLWDAKWKAPVIELEKPFQRGWVRYFTLTEQAGRRRDADDLAAAAKLVEHRQYCRLNKFFGRRKRGKRRPDSEHHPRRLRPYELLKERPPDRLLKYFETECGICIGGYLRLLNLLRVGFPGRIIFAQRHCLRSVVEPHMITHLKVHLPEVERRLAEIEAEYDRGQLYLKLGRLRGEHGESFWRRFEVNKFERAAEHDTREQIVDELCPPPPRCGDDPITEFEKGAGDRAFFVWLKRKWRPPSDVDDDRLRVGLNGIVFCASRPSLARLAA